MSEKTNTWGIGAIIYKLVTLRRVYENYRNPGSDAEFPIGQIITGHKPEYSSELRLLIRNCLKERPRDRPRLKDIQRIIRNMRRVHSIERVYYRGNEIREMSPSKSYVPELHELQFDRRTGRSVEPRYRAHGESLLHRPRFPEEIPSRESKRASLEERAKKWNSSFQRSSKNIKERDDSRFFVYTPSEGGGLGPSTDDDDEDDPPGDSSGNDDSGAIIRTSSKRKRPPKGKATGKLSKRRRTKPPRQARSGHPDISSPPDPANAPVVLDENGGISDGRDGVGHQTVDDFPTPEDRTETQATWTIADVEALRAARERQKESGDYSHTGEDGRRQLDPALDIDESPIEYMPDGDTGTGYQSDVEEEDGDEDNDDDDDGDYDEDDNGDDDGDDDGDDPSDLSKLPPKVSTEELSSVHTNSNIETEDANRKAEKDKEEKAKKNKERKAKGDKKRKAKKDKRRKAITRTEVETSTVDDEVEEVQEGEEEDEEDDDEVVERTFGPAIARANARAAREDVDWAGGSDPDDTEPEITPGKRPATRGLDVDPRTPKTAWLRSGRTRPGPPGGPGGPGGPKKAKKAKKDKKEKDPKKSKRPRKG